MHNVIVHQETARLNVSLMKAKIVTIAPDFIPVYTTAFMKRIPIPLKTVNINLLKKIKSSNVWIEELYHCINDTKR